MSNRFVNKSICMSRGKYFGKLKDVLVKPKKRHIYMGDFNYNFEYKSDKKYRDRNEREFAEIFSSSPLNNCIEGQKTHISRIHNTLTTTDMVLSTPEIDIIRPTVDTIAVMTGLDHFPIHFELKHTFKKPPRRLIKSRGKIYQNKPFCKKDPFLFTTEKFKGLKIWESENHDL